MRRLALPLLLLVALAGRAQAQAPIIMIDPGHGGDVAGSSAEGLEEKDLVLRMGFVAADEFVQHGFDVRLTRNGDYDIPFNDRRTLAEEAGAALMFSLHLKRDDDPAANGMEVYVNLDDERSAAAGETTAEALRALDMPVIVEGRDWGFLASPTVATVMIEAGFITNPEDRDRIISETYQRAFARALVKAAQQLLDANE